MGGLLVNAMMKSALFTFTLAGLLTSGCDREAAPRVDDPDSIPATVRVQTLVARPLDVTEEVLGTVRATLHARLEAKVSGSILDMRVTPGQEVRTGDLLLRLDLPEGRAQLDQALALQSRATNDLRRYRALLERNAVTQAEFDAIQSGARVAEAAVAEAESMLAYADVLAPFDGVITRKLADVGDLAAPGRSLLEMEDPTTLRLESNVGEALIDRIQVGQTLLVHIANQAGPLPATVSEKAPTADPVSRTLVVKLDLPPTPGLRSGLFGRVRVPVGTSERLILPASAVIRRGQLEYVFAAVEGRARLRLVRTGARRGDEVVLLSGAAEGDQVVVSGVTGLRDGRRLNIQP